jgi:ABC-type transport system substrate-binding protein
MRAIFDPIMVLGDDGEMHPYVAESVTPNEDFTEWTIVVRDGITFHDGTPLDGAAVAENLQRYRDSLLTGKGLVDVESVTVAPDDPMTVVITLSRPWVTFDYYLAGYVASPTWLAAADADPQLELQPVGSGPYTYVDYKVGQGFTAAKNESYWREGMPYLDEVEFRIVPDARTRERALLAGDIDMIHTTNGQSITNLREAGDDVTLFEQTDRADTQYILFNTQSAPLDDRRVRCALAHATDTESINESLGAGVFPLANGPMSPNQLGYLEETGFPTYDPGAAQALIEEYEAENGPIQITMQTTQDETNLLVAQAMQQMWEEAGAEVDLGQIEQGQFIVAALQGNFQAFQWRNHGGADAETQRVWWHSETALPQGQLALNFGRIADPVIDENLDVLREESDPARRQAAAEAINERFAEQCYNLWLSWTVWALAAQPDVHGLEGMELPDGATASAQNGGFWVAGIWKG